MLNLAVTKLSERRHHRPHSGPNLTPPCGRIRRAGRVESQGLTNSWLSSHTWQEPRGILVLVLKLPETLASSLHPRRGSPKMETGGAAEPKVRVGVEHFSSEKLQSLVRTSYKECLQPLAWSWCTQGLWQGWAGLTRQERLEKSVQPRVCGKRGGWTAPRPAAASPKCLHNGGLLTGSSSALS